MSDVVKRSWGRPVGQKNSAEHVGKIKAWFAVPGNKARHSAAIKAGILRSRLGPEPEEENEAKFE